MAYDTCRYSFGRTALQRYAGALKIRSIDLTGQVDGAGDVRSSAHKLQQAAFASGASAALCSLMLLDTEIEPDAFANTVMSYTGTGLEDMPDGQ